MNLVTIGSDYGLPPGRRYVIMWTIAGTNFSEILIKIHLLSLNGNIFKNDVSKISAILYWFHRANNMAEVLFP